MLRIIALVAATSVAGAVGFFSTLFLLDARSGRADADGGSARTRCEVQFGPERCPSHPDFVAMDRRNVITDTFDNADKDPARCMHRATEYFSWCQSRQSVTARFFRGTTIVRSVTHN
ncbi:MAG: hypothetical protein SFW09_16060 [Hyphomicrobiaceae bacterium]|nr:hypothetical protein [Hyphomicrobiaceae bacterium]